MDRLCQQRKRKRDRETRQKLEQQLQLLQEEKQDSPLAQLMKERNRNEERSIRHRTRLLQIKGLIQADLDDLDCSEATTSPEGDRNASVATHLTSYAGEPALPVPVLAENSDETSPLGAGDDLDAVHAFGIDDFDIYGPQSDDLFWPQEAIQTESDHINSIVAVPETSSSNKNGNQRELWEEVEQLIARGKPSLSSPSTSNTELDMHIIINAVSRGWSQFANAVRVDARWSCLRELDEKYFSRSYGPVERLAVLTIASQLMEGDVSSRVR